MAKAQKSGRTASEGAVYAVISDSKIAAIVEVNETDFVARSDAFKAFVKAFATGAMEQKISTDTIESTIIAGKSLEDARHAAVLNLGENIQVRRAQSLAASNNEAIYSYTHGDKICVVVTLEKEDAALGKDIAMHVAALNPAAITEDDIPAKILNDERAIYEEQLQGNNAQNQR